MSKVYVLSVLAIFMLMAGCVKEGIDGVDGKDGINGVDGQDGQDGNANVQTYNITVYPSDWIESGTVGESMYGYYALKEISGIDNDMVNNGAVLVYLNAGGSYVAMPVTFTYDGYTSIY